MSSVDVTFRELCDGWALGALGEEELKKFRRLLRDANKEMISTCRELERAALHLAIAPESEAPPSALKARVLAAVRSEKAAASGARAGRFVAALGLDRPRVAVTVTIALLALAIGLGFHVTTLHRAASQNELRIVDLSDRIQEQDRLLRVLQSREVEVVVLSATELNPQGYGKIIWDIESRVAVLQIANLPSVREDMSYQLWVYPKEGQPISAGTFAVRDPARDAFFHLENLTSLEKEAVGGFLITLEAASGASEPGKAAYLGGRSPS